jgi:hypothetical protein
MFRRNTVQVFWVVCCVVGWVLLDVSQEHSSGVLGCVLC